MDIRVLITRDCFFIVIGMKDITEINMEKSELRLTKLWLFGYQETLLYMAKSKI